MKDLWKKAQELQMKGDEVTFKELKDFLNFVIDKDPTKDFLSKDEIEEKFKSFIAETIPGGKLSHFWDQNECIDPRELDDILELSKKEDYSTFADAALAYVYENNFATETESEDIYEGVIKPFYEKYPEMEEQVEEVLDGQSELYEIFYEVARYDYDIQQLLKNSAPDDLTLYFGTNPDDGYSDLQIEFVDDFDNEKFLQSDTKIPLDWLIESQGYTREDLQNENIRKQSTFLTSVYAELFECMSDLYGLQLIAIPSSDDFQAIFDVSRKKGVICKTTPFGFFNRIHGCGTSLEIELEKDIVLTDDVQLYDLKMSYTSESYNYSPDAVYGLAKARRGADLIALSDLETEEEKK